MYCYILTTSFPFRHFIFIINNQVIQVLFAGAVISGQFLQQHTTWVPHSAVGPVLYWSDGNPWVHLRHKSGQEGIPKPSC